MLPYKAATKRTF